MTSNVHLAGGDMLLVMPVPEGWALRWYLPDCDQPHDYSAESRNGDVAMFLGVCLGPPRSAAAQKADEDDDDDEGYEEDDDDTRSPEQIAADEREYEITIRLCRDAAVRRDDDDEPIYFYWPTRQAADETAEAIMVEVRRDRAAPWAEAAIAAGWTPPPAYKSPYRD